MTHSSVLAWRIPGMGEPGGLPSLGLHRVGHDWSDLAAAASSKLALGIAKCVFLNFVGKIGVSSGLSVFGLLKHNVWDKVHYKQQKHVLQF